MHWDHKPSPWFGVPASAREAFDPPDAPELRKPCRLKAGLRKDEKTGDLWLLSLLSAMGGSWEAQSDSSWKKQLSPQITQNTQKEALRQARDLTRKVRRVIGVTQSLRLRYSASSAGNCRSQVQRSAAFSRTQLRILASGQPMLSHFPAQERRGFGDVRGPGGRVGTVLDGDPTVKAGAFENRENPVVIVQAASNNSVL